MKKRTLVALGVVSSFSGLLLFASTESHSMPPPRGRTTAVVLELFTSQGCSSCPPADKLLSAMGKQTFEGAVVIPLAYHVDYWNHLGWSDPFSSPSWSARQNDYARSMGSAQVYTPQLVVNGKAQLVGSDERGARRVIEREAAAGNRGTIVIDRLVREGANVHIDLHTRLDQPLPRGGARVMATLYQNGVTTAVRRGENSGRNLTNDFIVRWEGEVFALDGGGREGHGSVVIPVASAWNNGDLGVAVFVQDSGAAIYAAAAQRVSAR